MGWIKTVWIDMILDRTSRTVSLTPVTKTLTFEGEETLTDGTPANVSVVYLTREQVENFGKWGEVDENADAYVMTKASVTILKNYKLTVDSMTFRVDEVSTYYGDTNNASAMYKYAPLFRIS